MSTLKALYKCIDCGHEQEVSEVHTQHGVYAGSGANWCDACGDGKPERKERLAMTSLNTAGTVAIDRNNYWRPIDADTPRGVKLQLICKADNVATYSTLSSVPQRWDHWAPLPVFEKEEVK